MERTEVWPGRVLLCRELRCEVKVVQMQIVTYPLKSLHWTAFCSVKRETYRLVKKR